MLKASIVESEKQIIYMTHGDCSQEEIDTLVNLIKHEIPCRDVEVGYIGPIVGASVGPDTIGVWAYGQEVTFKIG